MTAEDVKRLVSAEVEAQVPFENFHGITRENLASFLVEPYEVVVHPDDLETSPRSMWVVLQERRDPREGYAIVFDPHHSSWGVAEFTGALAATLVVSAPTLAGVLAGM